MTHHLNPRRRFIAASVALTTLALTLCTPAQLHAQFRGRDAPAAPIIQEASHPPHDPGDELKISKTRVLRKSGVYDFKFQVLRWTGKGKCSQKEGQPPMFRITGKKIVLRNAFIIGAPDGIHVSGHDVKIENVYFMNVCEDAITVTKGVDVDIAGCYFYDAEDKVLQLNSGRDIEIYGNVFNRFSSAIRIKNDAKGVQVRDNLFYDGKRAIFADGKNARAEIIQGNRVVKVDVFTIAEKKAKLTITGRNELVNVREKVREKSGGKVREES